MQKKKQAGPGAREQEAWLLAAARGMARERVSVMGGAPLALRVAGETQEAPPALGPPSWRDAWQR